MALVVGPILTLINHAHAIITLDLGHRFALQTVLTFCVPYLVSTVSSAMTDLGNARAAATPGGSTTHDGTTPPGRPPTA